MNTSPRVILLFFLFVVSLTTMGQAAKENKEDDKRVSRIEKQADRIFVSRNIDKAMAVYESAFQHTMSVKYKAFLHLKVARLYLSLLDYTGATSHYRLAMASSVEVLGLTDVCNYLDALRFSGQRVEAAVLARKYAYHDEYSSNRRYLNILHALSYDGGYLPVGMPEFSVKPVVSINTPHAEYWVGQKAGEYFYASSSGRIHDPSKKYHSSSNYYSIDTNSGHSIRNRHKEMRFSELASSKLQKGPMSFSQNTTRIVITLPYAGKDNKTDMTSSGMSDSYTVLSYSDYESRQKKWSSFRPVFNHDGRYSYSHPCLFDDGNSLFFASDMPGGYGGYDIYVTHWDKVRGVWGKPLNLGPHVNTEGDEISPFLFNNVLVFSSNGHVGFGGYDIYGITYENKRPIPGSLVHFAYPVNTVHNDFGLIHIDKDRGYLVSDRETANKDDIFYFERNNKSVGSSNLLYGITESKAISNGSIDIMREKGNTNMPLQEDLPHTRYIELMCSVYFDFDSYQLTDDAYQVLNAWKNHTDFNKIETLIIEGYADELGREEYNRSLSEKRAFRVSNWAETQGIEAKQLVFGKGETLVQIDYPALMQEYGGKYTNKELIFRQIPIENKIKINQEARRVDIKAIIK